MISAAAYVLKVPENRREILLDHLPGGWFHSEERAVAEPVPLFDHSKRAPLIVFACFEDDAVTHIADGRKGASAGIRLVRLNMNDALALERPISFSELRARVPARLRTHINRILSSGGLLPPKSLGAFIDIILELQPQLAPRLERFSERRASRISGLPSNARTNLALQKETLTAALKIAGIRPEEVLTWSPPTGEQRSFLEGLPQAYAREDAALMSDFSGVPGFEFIKNFHFAAREFQSTADPSIRLKVLMTNRLALEEQTGADLIYYNETYKSFVMVQYKSMDKGSDGPEFRWRAKDKLAEEIERMDKVLEELAKLPHDHSPTSFRLHSNPFFLKLCPRVIFNPDDKGLFPGMYLPLELWRTLSKDPITEGPRGGRVLTYRNVGRKLTNSDFVTFVANAWVGTTVPQSDFLARIIEDVIQSGKTVTLAVKSSPPLGQVGLDDTFDDLV